MSSTVLSLRARDEPGTYGLRDGIDDSQVYAFSGYVEGQLSTTLARGYALAPDAQSIIDAMTAAGFKVVALTSRSELREMIGMLEAIDRGDPDAVDQGDLIRSDAMLRRRPDDGDRGFPLGEEHVFTFTGYVDASHKAWTGFAVALSTQDAVHHLGTFGFSVKSVASLGDLRRLDVLLDEIAHGEGEATACLDLFAEAA